ncbi:TPA: acyl-CoA desaturase [Escherichia fergusonii]|uniref:fatty acid desaturase family protein n=1 Tax=Escherichia fergusonii TaxID=564 RepID=UPI001752B676|nr:acyl-CoA desaturase [Escherichia fergusonii]HAI1304617.1 acyl-CoA desaturase [Escherichia fergusonii]HCO8232450.1 acyl-CoA desaturase [Escherichia fergusonii]
MNLFNPDRLITFPADDPQLVKQLQNDTKVYLAKSCDHRYADGWAFTKMAALIIACLCCYSLALSQSQWGLYLLWYLAMMFCAMMLAVNVVHDASHDAFLRGKKANAWLNRWVAFPMGLDPDCWRVRHVRFHHGFTNIEFYDPDTAENGILRQTPWQRWRPFMRQQHRYWPLVAALTFPWYIWVVDWLDRAGFTPVTRHLAARGFSGWGYFLAGKLAHCALCLILPWLLSEFGFMTILLTYLLSQLLASLIFVMLIIGTHWAKGHTQLPPEEGKMAVGRLAHTFATTFDWTPQPAWLGYWLGGINLHLTHHLFPHWHHRHYPALSRIIAQIASQQGLDYQLLTLADLLRLQQQFLRRMGEKPID